MITVKHNVLSDREVNKLLTLWYDTKPNHIITDGYKYNIEAVEILDYIDKLKLSYSFPKEHYRDFILQTIDETHSKAPNHDKYHRHENEWTYVMYLNDNYQGGEIEFTNGTIIKPQVGDVIYFSPEEGHRVKPPYNFTEQYFKYNGKSILMNKRWSLVGFMNSDIINENKKTCLI
jgi:hypothetical protein